MFGKLFDKIKKASEGFNYVVDFNALLDYMENEVSVCFRELSEADALDAVFRIFIYYNNERYLMEIGANKSRELIIKLDGQEIHGLEEFKTNARVGGRMLNSTNEYIRVVLPDYDSHILNKYKKEHPEMQ
jgi:hypothetical protein